MPFPLANKLVCFSGGNPCCFSYGPLSLALLGGRELLKWGLLAPGTGMEGGQEEGALKRLGSLGLRSSLSRENVCPVFLNPLAHTHMHTQLS